jgi:hypothetical protein
MYILYKDTHVYPVQGYAPRHAAPQHLISRTQQSATYADTKEMHASATSFHLYLPPLPPFQHSATSFSSRRSCSRAAAAASSSAAIRASPASRSRARSSHARRSASASPRSAPAWRVADSKRRARHVCPPPISSDAQHPKMIGAI